MQSERGSDGERSTRRIIEDIRAGAPTLGQLKSDDLGLESQPGVCPGRLHLNIAAETREVDDAQHDRLPHRERRPDTIFSDLSQQILIGVQ